MRHLTRWDEVFSTEESNEILFRIASEIAEGIPSSCADRKHIIAGITSRDCGLLCNYDLAYGELSAASAVSLRQCLAFFSKRKDLDIGVDKRAAALRKFYDSEEACLKTNQIFKSWSSGRFQFTPRVEQVLFLAQQKISSILGDLPSLSDIKLRFGPGATTQVKKRDASARMKLSSPFSCSEDLLPYVADVLEEMPGWIPFSEESSRTVVDVSIDTSRLDFVPKSAKTDRSIAIEPTLNQMVQLGIGDYMSDRLRQVGIDLRDQTHNQRLAREGSLTGALATLDLSSASDSVSRELVAHLLPVDWFLFLDTCRSGTIEYESSVMRLQKFSSMGNGFTFALESLIFFALAYASHVVSHGKKPRRSELTVYGDDIICTTSSSNLLIEVLRVSGFTLNMEKSFTSGPFRESCGADYLSGIDIRPCYVKDRLSGESIFTLHNFFFRNFEYEIADFLRSLIAPHLQIFGPDGYGDGHLLSLEPLTRYLGPKSKDASLPHSGWGGYIFDTYVRKSRKSFKRLSGDRVLPLYSIYASGEYPVRELGQATQPQYPLRYGNSRSTVLYQKNRDTFGVVLPGAQGYKRISVYTLTP